MVLVETQRKVQCPRKGLTSPNLSFVKVLQNALPYTSKVLSAILTINYPFTAPCYLPTTLTMPLPSADWRPLQTVANLQREAQIQDDTRMPVKSLNLPPPTLSSPYLSTPEACRVSFYAGCDLSGLHTSAVSSVPFRSLAREIKLIS